MKTATFTIDVEYDESVTDAESLATALDRLLEAAMSTPGILDDYGDPQIGQVEPAEDRLARGSKNPLKIKRFLRRGNLPSEIEHVQDIYAFAGELLDKGCSWNIVGDMLFEGEDGRFYEGSVEFLISEADSEVVKEALAEIEEETRE